jgi:hypothetical protein
MVFSNPYWTLETKLDLLARWIIVHSIIYYELNGNVVTDKQFDSNSQQFVRLVDGNVEVLNKTQYGYVMKDFDGSTGFDLYRNLRRSDKIELMHMASNILYRYGR